MVGKSTVGRSLTGSDAVADDAEDDDRQLDERRRDRTPDEQRGQVHGVVLACALGRLTWSPARPASVAIWPSVTTVSPGAEAGAITTSLPVRARRRSPGAPRPSGQPSRRRRTGPAGSACTAAVGTTIACGSTESCSVTSTNAPGHRRRSPFGNVALRRIVSVVGSTALSMKVTRARDRGVRAARRRRQHAQRRLRLIPAQLRRAGAPAPRT